MPEDHFDTGPNEQAQRLYQTFVAPIQSDIRIDIPPQEQIECLRWTAQAAEHLEDYSDKVEDHTIIFHCTNGSTSDPHHWLEIDIPDMKQKGVVITYIWDDTQQKIKGKTFVNKKNQDIWSGYTASDVTRQQIYPDVEE